MQKAGGIDRKNELLKALSVIAVFMLALYGRRLLAEAGILPLDQPGGTAGILVGYLVWLLPTLLTLFYLYGFDARKVSAELGLKSDIWHPVLFSFLATLPMMIGYFAFFGDKANGSPKAILIGAFLPAVMEEYLFRGFLFGQLFKRGRFGFIPAVVISSVAFGLGHLYQGSSVGSAVTVTAVTAVGGAWFSWLYVEWDRNLWLVMSLHFFMNLWWTVFPAGETAIGTGQANIFRFMTIIITVIATIYRGRRKGFNIRGSLLLEPEKTGRA